MRDHVTIIERKTEAKNKTQFNLVVYVCLFWSICYKPMRMKEMGLHNMNNSFHYKIRDPFNSENLKRWK